MKHLISITGAGPGDPELITVKARKRLEQADVVLYDALPGDALLRLAPPEALFIYAGKLANDGQNQQLRQEAIHQTLLRMARKGKKVVRLKGGDPMIFGRGAEEIRFCRQNRLRYEVIPGITAAMAAACEFEIPLTERNNSSMVLLYTGSRTNGRFDQLGTVVEVLKASSTVSLYMGLKNLGALADALIQAGVEANTRVNILSKVSHPGSESLCGTLANIASLILLHRPATPAMILIGKYAEIICEEESRKGTEKQAIQPLLHLQTGLSC